MRIDLPFLNKIVAKLITYDGYSKVMELNEVTDNLEVAVNQPLAVYAVMGDGTPMYPSIQRKTFRVKEVKVFVTYEEV